MDYNAISNISSLATLSSLRYLELGRNCIIDIAPLVANAGLDAGDDVGLTGNPLGAQAVNTHVPALRTRGVRVTFTLPEDGGERASSTRCGGGDGDDADGDGGDDGDGDGGDGGGSDGGENGGGGDGGNGGDGDGGEDGGDEDDGGDGDGGGSDGGENGDGDGGEDGGDEDDGGDGDGGDSDGGEGGENGDGDGGEDGGDGDDGDGGDGDGGDGDGGDGGENGDGGGGEDGGENGDGDGDDGGAEAVGELPGLHLRVGSFGARDLAGAFIPDDDLAYGARSSDVRVAAVEVVGSTTLRVVALGAGDAEIVVSATDLNGKSAESAFAVAVAELAISEEIALEADGESFSVDLSQLFPQMDRATTTAVAPKSNRPHVVAVRVRNQELLLVPGENEGVAEIVVTAAHDSGWQTTHRLHATVEVAPRPAFRGWRTILLRDAASDKSDR